MADSRPVNRGIAAHEYLQWQRGVPSLRLSEVLVEERQAVGEEYPYQIPIECRRHAQRNGWVSSLVASPKIIAEEPTQHDHTQHWGCDVGCPQWCGGQSHAEFSCNPKTWTATMEFVATIDSWSTCPAWSACGAVLCGGVFQRPSTVPSHEGRTLEVNCQHWHKQSPAHALDGTLDARRRGRRTDGQSRVALVQYESRPLQDWIVRHWLALETHRQSASGHQLELQALRSNVFGQEELRQYVD